MRCHLSLLTGVSILIGVSSTNALTLDTQLPESIWNDAALLALGVIGPYYETNLGHVIGIFEPNATWGQSGAAWGSLIDYWNYTRDAEYSSPVQQALLAQMGPNNDYMPPNQTKTEGNNDQAFWALTAMTAAEQQLPNPPSSPSWLRLAQNVFDLQAARWDTSSCGGGLRWQIFTFNSGYDYKNAISAGTFFQLAARLARFTGNQTYADWAEKSYEWTSSVGLIDSDFKVYDGALTTSNCSQPSRLQWTYNAATFLYGSAVMYNLTNGNAQWQNRTQGLLSAMSVFVPGNSSSNMSSTAGVLVEIACETYGTCTDEQYAFKGLAAQWMGATLQIAPFTANTIAPILQASASGAAAACPRGSPYTACGFRWTTGGSDGNTGFGQQLSALNVISATLAANASAPVTSNTTNVGTSSIANASNGAASNSPGESKGVSSKSIELQAASLAFAIVVSFSSLLV